MGWDERRCAEQSRVEMTPNSLSQFKFANMKLIAPFLHMPLPTPKLQRVRPRGCPLGTIKGHEPKTHMRLRLKPETAEMAFQCAESAGLNINAWFELMIRNAEADGTILRDRRERDLQLREMRHFTTAIGALLYCRSIEHFLEMAKELTRPHQKK